MSSSPKSTWPKSNPTPNYSIHNSSLSSKETTACTARISQCPWWPPSVPLKWPHRIRKEALWAGLRHVSRQPVRGILIIHGAPMANHSHPSPQTRKSPRRQISTNSKRDSTRLGHLWGKFSRKVADSFWPNRINNCSNSNNSYNQLTQLRRYHHLSSQWPNAALQRQNSLSRRYNRIIPPLNCRLSSSHAYSQRSLSSKFKDSSGVIPSQRLRNIPLPKILPK